MNTADKGHFIRHGIQLPSYADLAPEAKVIYLQKENKLQAFMKAYSRIAKSLSPANFAFEVPSWEPITSDALKLHTLTALNMSMLALMAQINQEKVQKDLVNQRAQQIMARPDNAPTPPKLVRTESMPVNEALRQMGQQQIVTKEGHIKVTLPAPRQVQADQMLATNLMAMAKASPSTQLLRIVAPSGAIITSPRPESPPKTQQQEEEKKEEPVSSSETQQAGRITGASASPTQEQQGSTNQILEPVTKVREEVRKVLESHKEATKRVTRGQLQKWANDPKVKEEVLAHL